MKTIASVTLLLVMTATASFANDAAAVAAPADYHIGVEDLLDISVWGIADLQKTLPVRPDGKISLPLVNDVVAAGLTPMELRDQLAKQLAAFVHNPNVSVVVREIRSLKVSVIGQVHAPGRYDLKGPSTVLDALALAGGLTDFAARRKITILRNDGSNVQRLHCDYDAAIRSDQTNSNVRLKPGDIVVVP